jgi:uncharacterized membrane protein YgdD (TMEM256/DUF423 family)
MRSKTADEILALCMVLVIASVLVSLLLTRDGDGWAMVGGIALVSGLVVFAGLLSYRIGSDGAGDGLVADSFDHGDD